MWNYVFISVFLALIFEMAGIPVASSMLGYIGINLDEGVSSFQSSVFWIALVVMLSAATVSGIAIGFLTKSQSENYVIIPFIVAQVFIFLSVLIGIASQAQVIGGWVFYITLLIIAPLVVGFAVSAYETFRGSD